MKVCVWSWCAFRQRREWISGTNTNNEVELGLSHVRHTIHSTPLFNIPLAVKIQFFPMSEYKLHIKLPVQTHARTHAMAVYVQMVMIIKASTCMFWWPINRCWCFHLIHTGRGGGYSRIYGSVTGTNLVPPSPSSSPSSSSPTAPPSSWSKGVWRHENGNSSILYERMEKQSVLFIYIFIYFSSWPSSYADYLSGWSASVLRTQRRKGHVVVFVSSQVLTPSCLLLLLLLSGYGCHCCVLSLICVGHQKGRGKRYPHHCCYALFFIT